MPIIGRLIKKTSEITHKRSFNKGVEYKDQLKTLEKLLFKAAETVFGKKHVFHKILKSNDSVAMYQAQVPITDYDAFYQEWLIHSILGERDFTWPGRIKHFALSSGTSGSPSKRIPVTEDMIRSFQKTSVKQLSTLHELELPNTFFTGQILAVGGSTKLVKKKTHIEGDLSGILKKHTSFVVTPFTKPGVRITNLKDWNKKLELMIQEAPKWNIGIIAGVPSWCILLLEKIIEHYKLDSIHDIWPNFQVYLHGGVYMEPYKERLKKVTTKEVFLLDTYLASEGYFAYQKTIHSNGMQLLLNAGIFYEFIPFTNEFFDENGNIIDAHKAFTLSQVKENIDYAIVLTTNAGLWRYMLGDLVRFTNVEERSIKITGRIKQFLSLCGEHLSLDNIVTAVQTVARAKNIEITEFCLFADTDHQRHSWFFGTNNQVEVDELLAAVDQELGLLNDDYFAVRKHTLKTPVAQLLPVDTFYAFMESIGKAGAQNKVPRVMNVAQTEKWLAFLAKH
ncbi:MAG: hypothetical protein RIT10_1924 [Bacteroidota bacterium]|jgi:hypothetical protein